VAQLVQTVHGESQNTHQLIIVPECIGASEHAHTHTSDTVNARTKLFSSFRRAVVFLGGSWACMLVPLKDVCRMGMFSDTLRDDSDLLTAAR
jgi:hypothetical protein